VAEAQEEAIGLADQGDHQAAAQRLRAAGAEIRQMSSSLGAAAAPMASRAASEADMLEANGMSNEQRKAYRADSYQRTNQTTAPRR
jgi:arginine deiminase